MHHTEQSNKNYSEGRTFIKSLKPLQETIKIAGWIQNLRIQSKTTFIVLKDCTGTIQCVVATEYSKNLNLKLDQCIEIIGKTVHETRSKSGVEFHVTGIHILSENTNEMPFHSNANFSEISQEFKIENRPLVLRNEKQGQIFKLQAFVVEKFREFLRNNEFTEIMTSKIVSSGTEGGTNLFQLKYFEKVAYLAQSPQFYKEQCVAGLERVFETGHVYRAEPHATSRHLTEYFSLDIEMGFIQGPEELIELEKQLLTKIFSEINLEFADTLNLFQQPQLPDMNKAPTWEFNKCLELLKYHFNRTDLVDDLDGLAEKQLCELAVAESGVPAVFVLGFPLQARPFYTAPRGSNGAAQSFDLLFRGLEITTGGQRLHKRSQLEKAIVSKGMSVSSFEGHLRQFETGMPPHGGFAIGAERLVSQILGLGNVREATLYPRDRYRVEP